jgi:hypothetical protein
MQDIVYYFLPDKNKIIHKIAKTKMAKRCINSFVVMIFSFTIKSILYSLFSFIILFDNLYIDFFTQCGISIVLCNYNEKIQYIADYFEEDFYKLTRFIVNNYSDENYKKWKNYLIGLLLIISYLYFYFFEINSFIIRIYILQYAMCYIFIEVKENKNIFNIDNYLQKKYFILDKSIKKTDYIMIHKKKMPQSISSEFDIVENIKKSNSFEILDS